MLAYKFMKAKTIRSLLTTAKLSFAASLALLLPLAAAQSKPNVATTTTMISDMVQRVGGDDITVYALMGPGVDPHLYKPSARDVARLRGADIIFYNGLMLEGRMADVFTRISRSGTKVYAITEDLDEGLLLESEDYEGHWDPHVWFAPSLWAQCIEVVVKGLSGQDPANAANYRARGDALRDEYLAVGAWSQSRLQEVPPERRILVTSHDAFNYFGRAYDFQVVGVQGLSTASEAGLADITSTVDFIKKQHIPAIFIESSVAPAAIQRISRDSGAHIGGELFSDAMGKPGTLETGPDGETYDVGTWPGMIKHNINTITEALK